MPVSAGPRLASFAGSPTARRRCSRIVPSPAAAMVPRPPTTPLRQSGIPDSRGGPVPEGRTNRPEGRNLSPEFRTFLRERRKKKTSS